MDIADIPLFAMLRSRLGYLSDRQRIIAENVANADTPSYGPRDLKPFSFQVNAAQSAAASVAPVVLAATQPGHIQPPGGPRPAAAVKRVKSADSEMTLDGNGVVLEEEMMKLTQARMDYDAAVGFYQKSMDILKLAIRRPGAGA